MLERVSIPEEIHSPTPEVGYKKPEIVDGWIVESPAETEEDDESPNTSSTSDACFWCMFINV